MTHLGLAISFDFAQRTLAGSIQVSLRRFVQLHRRILDVLDGEKIISISTSISVRHAVAIQERFTRSHCRVVLGKHVLMAVNSVIKLSEDSVGYGDSYLILARKKFFNF